MTQRQFCFVTEADLDRQGVGGVVTDKQMLRCLRQFGDVDVIFLRRIHYRSTPLALIVFFFQILKSFGKPYQAYFSRGLVATFSLCFLNALTLSSRKIVHRALSVPFASKEVRFLKFGDAESLFRFGIFLWIERFVYSQVSMVTAASASYASELVEEGVPLDKVFVTNFVVEDAFFEPGIKIDRKGAFSFCYVGGFHKYQDLQPLLQAFEMIAKSNKNIQLLMVGDGPQRHTLEVFTRSNKLADRLRFVGRIPHSSLPSFLSNMDCFVSLTRKPGLSISIVEAAAAGKPIIAFSKEANETYNEYFHHRREIFLINSVHPESIASAMRVLYEDASLRDNIAHGARRVAKQNFSRQVAQEQLGKLIQKTSGI